MSTIQHLQKNPTMPQKRNTSANTPVVPKNVNKGKVIEHGDAYKSNISRNEETHSDSWKHNLNNFEAQMQRQRTDHSQSGATMLSNSAGKTVPRKSGGKLDTNICKSTVKENAESYAKSQTLKDTYETVAAKNKPVLTGTMHKQLQSYEASQSDSTQLPKQSKSQKTKTRLGEATSATRPTMLHHREATAGSHPSSTPPNRKQTPTGRKAENVTTGVTTQKTLSNMLHVEFMEQTPFAGNGVLPFTSDSADYATSGFAHELKGILNEHLMTSRMSDNMNEFLSRIGARSEGVGVGGHPNGVQLYEAEMQKLRRCSDDEVNERLEKKDTFSQKSKLSISAFDEYQNSQQLMFNAKAAAFVDVCVHTGLLKKAQTLLVSSYVNRRHSKRKTHQPVKVITDVDVYNALMHAWAAQGNLDPIRKLMVQMNYNGVTPTFQSYAACLECLGRQTLFASNVATRILADIEAAGFHLDAISSECHFTQDQWQHVDKAIKMVMPEFEARPVQQDHRYNCSLLESLNDKADSPSANPFWSVVSVEELKKRLDTQLDMELKDRVTVTSIEPPVKLTEAVKSVHETLQKVKSSWRSILSDSFIRNRHITELKAKGDPGTSLVPYLRIFDVATYVDMMMQEIETLGQEMATFSPTFSLLQLNLGCRLYKKFVVQVKVKQEHVCKVSELYSRYLDCYSTETLDSNHRQMWQDILSRHLNGTSLQAVTKPWPYQVSKSIGKFLYSIILADVKVNANCLKTDSEGSCDIPAFYTVFRQRTNEYHEEIKPHPVLVKLYKEAGIRELTFDPHHMPLMTPPMPWTSVTSGGSLLGTTDLVRHTYSSPQQMALLDTLPPPQLYPIYDALNCVSATPWIINKPILDVIIEVFNSGGDMHLDVPHPASAFPEPPKIVWQMSSEKRIQAMYERRRLSKQKKEMFGLWCTELYRLSIANKYREEIFWFPHNMDFRGRVYACPPHFNHLGSDLARSILVFAKCKPLGPQGLNWLKIHLINLTGLRKRSPNQDRLQCANDLMDEILDSADRPLTGNKWWQKSDEPWQTLSCCMEIAKVVRSPDPEAYMCHLPVHQDGSCNGLQHYATLGRDQVGAESVNLCPFDTPKDVYSDVVEKVESERQKDAANGLVIAQVLDGFVKRKVIKQTIMTTVYGVTKYGARQQIRGQLEGIEDFPQKHTWDASFYLTDKTFKCLQQMFTSTKDIQDWFVLSAKLVSKVCLKPMEWVTPIGWPVVQPYFRQIRIARPKDVILPHQLKYINMEKPNAMKQKNAFPPNFIHSLDSTHMMLTAIYCLRAGVTFVSVHDCFWTHAGDVAVMNKICREQFVGLHSQPILEELAQFLLKKFGFDESKLSGLQGEEVETVAMVNYILNKVPHRGDFQLENVLESTYFFS